MKSRILLTIGAFIAYFTLSHLFMAEAILQTGAAAVSQLSNSDSGYRSWILSDMFWKTNWPTILFIVSLIGIWWKPAKGIFLPAALVFTVFSVTAVTVPENAYAYYDQTDRAEWFNIEANQSAFLIPMYGANKDKQAQFGSIEYLAANKVAAKRIQIPHAKADNTSAFRDYYVSTAKLFLLDRTPVQREWAASVSKGTSDKDQGFTFETAEGSNIGAAIGIAAYVTEEDAAKFFYWFGAANSTSQKPEDTFASAAYAKSLAEVMDGVVRMRVHALLAKEFGKRPFLMAVRAKAEVIDTVEAAIKAEFKEKGITVSFVGYASQLDFAKDIQTAIDEAIVNTIKEQNKAAYNVAIDLDQRRADIKVTEAKALTMQKWDGKITMPNFLMLGKEFMDWIGSFFKSGK